MAIAPMAFQSSVGAALERQKGVGVGFDYLRILLALVVFNGHIGAVFNGRSSQPLLLADAVTGSPVSAPWASWREPLYILVVPAFFALSGFLVAGSAIRLRNVSSFLIFRGLRIVPALFIEVCLSALMLGPFYTSLDLRSYFGSSGLLAYFGNIIGVVQFFLPGVFLTNPVSGIVNNSLWTLPSEFHCYLISALLMMTGAFYNTKVYTWIFLAASVTIATLSFLYHWGLGRGNLPAEIVVYHFFVGVAFYHFRAYVPLSVSLAVGSAIIAFGCSYTHLVMIEPIFTTYVIIYFGVITWPYIPLLRNGDYSYGIYLYHFPIAQAVIASLPALRGSRLAFEGIALAFTVAFAVISWHVLEKPALRLKRFFVTRKTQLLPSIMALLQAAPMCRGCEVSIRVRDTSATRPRVKAGAGAYR